MSTELTYLEKVASGLTKFAAVPVRRTLAVFSLFYIFLIDVSGSMEEKCGRLTRLKAAGRAVLKTIDARAAMNVDDVACLISFNDSARVILPPTTCLGHRKTIAKALARLKPRDGTDLNSPLVLARAMIPAQGQVHMILLSDGLGGNPVRNAQKLKDDGVIIETVGVGNSPTDVDEKILKATASVLDGKVLYRFHTSGEALGNYFENDIAYRLVKREKP